MSSETVKVRILRSTEFQLVGRIFDAVDMSNSHGQFWQIIIPINKQNGYFRMAKEDCEVVEETPKFVIKDIDTKKGNISVTFVPAPDLDKIDGKVPPDFEPNFRNNIIDLDPTSETKVSLDLTKEKSLEKERRKAIDKYFGGKSISEMAKDLEENLTTPVIKDGHFQFDKEKLERLSKLHTPTDKTKNTFEDKIKNKLLIRGFSNETIINNRGLIGAVIDEVILEVVKNHKI